MVYVYIPIHHQLRIIMRNAWTHRSLLFDRILAKEPKWKKWLVLSLTLWLVFAFFFIWSKNFIGCGQKSWAMWAIWKEEEEKNKRATNKQTHTFNTNAYACTHILRIECCLLCPWYRTSLCSCAYEFEAEYISQNAVKQNYELEIIWNYIM